MTIRSISSASTGRGGVDARKAELGGVDSDNKELMHVLESTLITWTKQIKNVLKQVRLVVKAAPATEPGQ